MKHTPKKPQRSQNSFTESNLILFLKNFTKEEMREFAKFVNSPFHNNRSEVILFFDELKKFYPEFNSSELSKENIFTKLYPKQKYKDDVIRRLASNLFKLGEEYGSYKVFNENFFEKEKSLLKYYASKNADKFFWKQSDTIEKYMKEQPLRDAEYFHKLSELNEIELKYILKDDPTYKKSSYEKQAENLWKYILAATMRVHGFAEFETYFFNKTFKLNDITPLLKIAEESNFMGSKAIEIYYLIVKLYGPDKSDKILYRLISLIEENLPEFEKSECFSFYVHLINYCNINKIANEKEYNKIKFEIIQEIVKHDLVIQNGVIDPGWFRGIFSMAFNSGEMKFAEEFIEKYKSVVAGKDKENVVKHAYANLAIYKKDFDAALNYLSTSSYQHINDKWTVKQMYLTIYYEINNFEQFSYVADSMKHLIKEEGSWNENLILPIRNFINYLTKLFRIKLGELNVNPDELRDEVIKSKIIARKWLFEKIDEIEKQT